MIFADAPLARRLEAAEVAIAQGCRGENSSAIEIAGGYAVFAGVGSPLTQAVGVGMNGPLAKAELDRLEEFFRDFGATSRLELCPLADPGFVEALADRGYRVSEFNNVLVRRLEGYEPAVAHRIRAATPEDREIWSYTVGAGFFEQAELTAAEMDIGRVIFDMPGAICYLSVTESGQPAGGAALALQDGLAVLFSDSTLAAWRRQGRHGELIVARLNHALANGCTLASAGTLPGSGSQRNYERLGFQVAYTRATLVREFS